MKIIIGFGTVATVGGLIFPAVTGLPAAIALLWVVFFFGGAVMPSATGIMLSSVPRPIRAFASSMAQLFQNLLGYLPSPFLYGVVKNSFGHGVAMTLLMGWSLWGVTGLGFAQWYQLKQMEGKSKKNGRSMNLYRPPTITGTAPEDEIEMEEYTSDLQPPKKSEAPLKRFGGIAANLLLGETRPKEEMSHAERMQSMYADANRFSRDTMFTKQSLSGFVSLFKGALGKKAEG